MTKTTKTIYITSDKQEFPTEAEAQAHEIDQIEGALEATGPWVVTNRDAILTILGARKKVRSDKGKSRKVRPLHPMETLAALKGA
jgi:hypothetical protein